MEIKGNPVPINGQMPSISDKTQDQLLQEIQQLKKEIDQLEKQYNEAEATYKVKVQQRQQILSQIAQIISQQTNKQINPDNLTQEMVQQYISTIQQQIQIEVSEIQQAILEYKQSQTQIQPQPETNPTGQAIQATQQDPTPRPVDEPQLSKTTDIDLSFLQ